MDGGKGSASIQSSSRFLRQGHAAFGTLARTGLHDVGVHGTGVLHRGAFGSVIAARAARRFTANECQASDRQKSGDDEDGFDFVHGVFESLLLFGASVAAGAVAGLDGSSRARSQRKMTGVTMRIWMRLEIIPPMAL